MTAQNPYKKYETAFEGWPSVAARRVRGENGMQVGCRHFTPDRQKTADMLTVLAALVWGAGLAACFYVRRYDIAGQEELWTAVACALWVALVAGSRFLIRPYLEKTTIVLFSPSHIQIGHRVYDTRLQHKFSMELYRKAADEADAELRAQQRGQGRAHVRHFKYYRKAFHIYFEYLGQKILVTDISNPEYAEKLLRALNAVDRIVHKEKTMFAANVNAEEPAADSTEERQVEYFGRRPALD